MNVHLRGSFLMSREVQKHMVAAKYGKILNLSWVSALGNRGQANYSAAKMGLQGFTRTLALELGPFGINVNAIAPGFIVTDMTDDTARRVGVEPEEFRKGAAAVNPVAPGRATPRTSPPPLRSCAATRRRTSPARRCTSTAARRSERATRGGRRVPPRPFAVPHLSAHGASSPHVDRIALRVAPAAGASAALVALGADRRPGADRLHEQGRRRDTPAASRWRRGSTVAGAVAADRGARERQGPEAPGDGRQDRQHRSSRPQIGLSKADLVTEELVEGGSTRLAVFYYQSIPGLVGPVRSMRATDIGIVKPAKAVLVASGGAPPTVAPDQGRRHQRVHRGRARLRARQQPPGAVQPVHAPQGAGREAVERRKPPCRATCRSGRRQRPPPGAGDGGWIAVFSGAHTTDWTYRGGKYVNRTATPPGRRVPGPTTCSCCGS